VRIHAQGDGRVRVAEPSGNDVDRNAVEQEGCGVDVAKIVNAGMW
jgi:hypothetical protein